MDTFKIMKIVKEATGGTYEIVTMEIKDVWEHVYTNKGNDTFTLLLSLANKIFFATSMYRLCIKTYQNIYSC